MLRRRSSISSTNTSKIRERRFKIVFTGAGTWLKRIGILLIIFLLTYFVFRLLIINNVVCYTNKQPCSQDLENLLVNLKGKNVLFINRNALKDSIKNIFPVDDVKYSFKLPNKLEVNVIGWQEAIPIDTYQVINYPMLSMDVYGGATDSGTWNRPVTEIQNFLNDQEPKSQRLWGKGRLTLDSTVSGTIKDIFVSNQDEDTLSNIYQLTLLSEKYLSNPKIYVLGSRFFLSQDGLPDIIIYIPADLGRVESALQSINYLVTIKKDAKVIDLSFKHPIIK